MAAIILDHFDLETFANPDAARPAHPLEVIRDPCDKCQQASCSVLHDYSTSSCPYKTCTECLELQSLDAQISDAQNVLINLSRKRSGVKEKINHRHDRFTSHLPVEVVSHIFLLVANSDKIRYKKNNRSHQWNPALLLGAICRRWRNITLRLPQLWTKVKLNPYKHASLLDITGEWLSRSGVLPLSLKMGGATLVSDLSQRSLNPSLASFVELLRVHSSRWRELDLQIKAFIVHGLFDDLRDIQGLQSLTISTVGDGVEMEPVTMQNPIVPNHLSMKRFSLAGFSFEWGKLTDLDVASLSVDEVVHVFTHAHNLRSSSVTFVQKDAGHYPLPTSPVTNKSTIKLDLYEGDLLRYITLPALENLTYRVSKYGDPMDGMNELAAFIDRSEPPLLAFFINYCVDLPRHGNEWYQMFPSVTHLKIDLDFLDGADVERVRGYVNGLEASLNPIAFPRLQDLKMVVDDMGAESWRSLVRIFSDQEEEDENAPVVKRPLKSVTIYVRRSYEWDNEDIMDNDTYTRLLAVQESGVILQAFDEHGYDLLEPATSSETDEDEGGTA